MIQQPLLESLEMLLKVSSSPVTLNFAYDSVQCGRLLPLYTCFLKFKMLKKDPITPVAPLYTQEDTRKIT